MSEEVITLHNAIVHFEAIGSWYMADYCRSILVELLKDLE